MFKTKYVVLVSFPKNPFEYYISKDKTYADYSDSRNFGIVGRNNINYATMYDTLDIAQRLIQSLGSESGVTYNVVKAEVQTVIAITETIHR